MADAFDVDRELANAIGPLRDFVERYVRSKGYGEQVSWATADRFCNATRSAFNLLRVCAEGLIAPPTPRG